MKRTQKRKTFAFQQINYQFLHHKRNRNSTVTNLKGNASRLVIFDVIEHLLSKVYEQQRQRTKFLQQTLIKLGSLQINDCTYFNLELEEQPEILCKQDIQPIAEETRTLEVIKSTTHLKKSSKKMLVNETLDQSDVNDISIIQLDKKDRENTIQRLKKQYSMILQSKYSSNSTPIGESRAFFIEGETPEIIHMRNNFGKIAISVKKQQQLKHKPSFVQEQIRKNHKLNTIFKKSKDFLEMMDPTMSNSLYLSQVEPQNSSHKNSVMTPQAQQDQVIVKLSKFKDITNSIKTKKEIASDMKLPLQTLGTNNNKMVNLIAEQQRQQLKIKVERSFQSNDRMKFREVSETERKPKQSNSISVSFLPKISRV